MNLHNFLYQLKTDIKGLTSYPKLTQSEVDYEAYWQKKKHSMNDFQVDRARFVEQHIKSGDSVIDIASGTGCILEYLKNKKAISPQAYDLSQFSKAIHAEKKIDCDELDLNDEKKMASLPKAKHILAFEVLEHLANPEKVIVSLMDKAQETVFISVPNTGHYTYRLRLLFGRFPVQWRHHPGEHLRFWTKNDMIWWLSEMNLLNQSQIYFYQGIPFLNKVFPGIFAKGILVKIKKT